MESASARMMAGVAFIVIVWIATFWLYEPGGRDAQGLAPLPQVSEAPMPAARADVPRRPAPPAANAAPVTPIPDPAPVPPPAPPPAAANPAPVSGPSVIPPQFEEYTVKPGETLETIARARYGSSKQWAAIAQANPMKDPKRLKAGDVIRLPKDPTNIQGKPAPAGTTAPAAGADGPFTSYTVKDGDTLTGIARELWGSSKGWRKILDANKGVLPSEDRLKVGMVLRVPPKPAD